MFNLWLTAKSSRSQYSIIHHRLGNKMTMICGDIFAIMQLPYSLSSLLNHIMSKVQDASRFVTSSVSWTSWFSDKYERPFEKWCRPAIHSAFIWIIQIFFLKFSEIQINWLKIQFYFGFEFGRDFYIKVLFWYSNSDSFLYIPIFLTFIQILRHIKEAGLVILSIAIHFTECYKDENHIKLS